jgi:hypothetical protein
VKYERCPGVSSVRAQWRRLAIAERLAAALDDDAAPVMMARTASSAALLDAR